MQSFVVVDVCRCLVGRSDLGEVSREDHCRSHEVPGQVLIPAGGRCAGERPGTGDALHWLCDVVLISFSCEFWPTPPRCPRPPPRPPWPSSQQPMQASTVFAPTVPADARHTRASMLCRTQTPTTSGAGEGAAFQSRQSHKYCRGSNTGCVGIVYLPRPPHQLPYLARPHQPSYPPPPSYHCPPVQPWRRSLSQHRLHRPPKL